MRQGRTGARTGVFSPLGGARKTLLGTHCPVHRPRRVTAVSALAGQILGAPLLDRLQAVRDHVLVPREKLRASSEERATALAKEPCRIVLKTMYPLDSLPHLFRTVRGAAARRLSPLRRSDSAGPPPRAPPPLSTQVLPSLPHENDGLIFTPMDAPYTLGTDYRLLKWKVGVPCDPATAAPPPSALSLVGCTSRCTLIRWTSPPTSSSAVSRPGRGSSSW